jgi:hypothetical protein
MSSVTGYIISEHLTCMESNTMAYISTQLSEEVLLLLAVILLIKRGLK